MSRVFDLHNERVLLASIAKDPDVRRKLVNELSVDAFGDPKHKVLFSAARQLTKMGLEWSEDTVRDLAGGDDFGGFKYLRGVLEDYDASANVDYHVDRALLDSAKFRFMSELLPSLSEMCSEPRSPREKIRSLLKESLEMFERTGGMSISSGRDRIDAFHATMKARKVTGGRLERTGWPLLDECVIQGLGPGLSLVVGRPSVGKSTWVANLILRRLELNSPTFFCSWEMDQQEIQDKLVSARTGVPTDTIRKRVRGLSDEEKTSIFEAVEWIGTDSLAIHGYPFTDGEMRSKPWELNSRNLDYLESLIARYSHKFRVFVVDVVSKLLPWTRPDAVSNALIRIRKMAYAESVHLMLIHHLRRDAADARPTLEAIKGAGAYEEEADLILGLDRPWMRLSAARKRTRKDTLDVWVLKQRHGPAPLCVRYMFDGGRSRLLDEEVGDINAICKEDAPSG